MTLKKQNELLIQTLVAVYPVTTGRGLITIGTKMMAGQTAIKAALQEVGAMEKPRSKEA